MGVVWHVAYYFIPGRFLPRLDSNYLGSGCRSGKAFSCQDDLPRFNCPVLGTRVHMGL